MVKEAYDEQVLVKEAWDENILVKDGYNEQVLIKEAWTETVKGDCAIYSQDIIGNFKCTACGAIFMTSPEAREHIGTHPAEEVFASYNNTTTYAGEYHCTSWFPDETINHPAEYKTVYHDPEYKTIHHEAEYKTVHHDAKYEQRWIED